MNFYKILDLNPNVITIKKDGVETRYSFKDFDIAKHEVMIWKKGEDGFWEGEALRGFLEKNQSGGPSQFPKDKEKMKYILDNYFFDPIANSSYIRVSDGGYRRYSRKNIKKSAKRRVKSAKRASKSRKYRRQSK